MKYVIRHPFTIKLGRDLHHHGDVVDLSDDEAQDHLHKIEPFDPEAAEAAAKAADEAAKAAAEAEAEAQAAAEAAAQAEAEAQAKAEAEAAAKAEAEAAAANAKKQGSKK